MLKRNFRKAVYHWGQTNGAA
uniref:Uncharacterized protein n=1 Tax=Arundo donax TaxID=35708 RepID=A0A0A9HAW6_ARUDO